MNVTVSGNRLAAFLGVSARSIGRLERRGLIERRKDGTFPLEQSVQRLFHHYLRREHWAFAQLRRFRIFDETAGDVFDGHHW